MSEKLITAVISKMHVKLNQLIENRNYNLLNCEVQQYSRRLDRALLRYNRIVVKQKLLS